MVNALLSITFACGLIIAALHVLNRRFIAPVYDVILNLTAFSAAVASSALLQHWLPASLSLLAVFAWISLGVRTAKYMHNKRKQGRVKITLTPRQERKTPTGLHGQRG